MKRLLITIALFGFVGQPCVGETNYYFKVDAETHAFLSRNINPNGTWPAGRGRAIMVHVTKAQMGAGKKADWDALDQAVKDAAYDEAATESGLEIFKTDAGLLLRAYIACMKILNPDITQPNKTQLLTKFNKLKEAQ